MLWVFEFLGDIMGDIIGESIGSLGGSMAGDLASRARGPVGSDAVVSLPTGEVPDAGAAHAQPAGRRAAAPTPARAESSERSAPDLGDMLATLRRAVRAAQAALGQGAGGSASPAEATSVDAAGRALVEAASAVVAFLKRRSARAGGLAQQRLQNLMTALRRFTEEAEGLAQKSAFEQQRLVAAALRLCTWAELELGPGTARSKPSLSAAPGATAGRRAEPVPGPTPAQVKTVGSTSEHPAITTAMIPVGVAAADPAQRGEADSLSRPVLGLPGVGERTAERLATRGLLRVLDVLYFLPRRWEDLRSVLPVGALQPGVVQSTVVIVERSRIVPSRRRFLDVMARGVDGTPLSLRWFYFNGGMLRRLQPGQRLRIAGSPQPWKGVLQIVHPEVDYLETEDLATGDGGSAAPVGRVRTRYPEIEGVPPRTLERLCRHVCERFSDAVPDGLPEALRQKLSLPHLSQALRSLHLVDGAVGDDAGPPPELLDQLNQGMAPAQRRLIFEELFFLQLGLIERRKNVRAEVSAPCLSDEHSLDPLRQVLPFVPTRAQERAIREIAADLARPLPMQRLVHGDVGSGKTLVAYAACELVMAAGRQAAIMAPTEILAEQHARTLGAWARATGRRLALLTATTPKTARKSTLALLQAGRYDDVWGQAERGGERLDRETILALLAAGYLHIVVGTHALIADRVEFADLGLVVIDEQHRFGVAQRARLRRKGRTPHLLVMTATPIPRTLALTLYGDLDITQLDELPPGRTPPVTRVLSGAGGLSRALLAVRRAVATERQAYWVCPLIEESEKIDFQSVTARHASLQAALPELRIGLVHGRLLSNERDEIMDRFRAGELHVLCATTVIEVGVDVPNASLMVIEGADRFGLAQLHQLRGRIGRGSGASACLLLHDTPAELPAEGTAQTELPRSGASDDSLLGGSPAKASRTRRARPTAAAVASPAASPEDSPLQAPAGDAPATSGAGGSQGRLAVLAQSSNGFHIAEADLRMRGPGEVLGTRQAGLPPLRYADLLRDIDLLQIARREAAALLRRDPELELPEHAATRRLLRERWALAEEKLSTLE